MWTALSVLLSREQRTCVGAGYGVKDSDCLFADNFMQEGKLMTEGIMFLRKQVGMQFPESRERLALPGAGAHLLL